MTIPADFRPELPPRRRAALWVAAECGRARAVAIDAKHPGAGARVRRILAERRTAS